MEMSIAKNVFKILKETLEVARVIISFLKDNFKVDTKVTALFSILCGSEEKYEIHNNIWPTSSWENDGWT